MLRSQTGLADTLEAISIREQVRMPDVGLRNILLQQAPMELAERTAGVQYPVFYVYCEKLTNQLKEKFRTFSGKARLAVEVRVTHDRLENLNTMLELCAEGVTDVLDAHRGDWQNGLFYTGGYEVTFGPAKHGGKNFIQGARVVFEVDVSIG
jgi:hypothetical protein